MLRPAHAIRLSLIALTLGLTGCTLGVPIGPATVAEGECKIVEAPKYQVLGKTNYDQAWINRTTESIVEGCKQARPIARPAELDATYTVGGKTVPVPKPTKKKPWWKKTPIPAS